MDFEMERNEQEEIIEGKKKQGEGERINSKKIIISVKVMSKVSIIKKINKGRG